MLQTTMQESFIPIHCSTVDIVPKPQEVFLVQKHSYHDDMKTRFGPFTIPNLDSTGKVLSKQLWNALEL